MQPHFDYDINGNKSEFELSLGKYTKVSLKFWRVRSVRKQQFP